LCPAIVVTAIHAITTSALSDLNMFGPILRLPDTFRLGVGSMTFVICHISQCRLLLSSVRPIDWGNLGVAEAALVATSAALAMLISVKLALRSLYKNGAISNQSALQDITPSN